ncbi:NtaA/DmoA family FMN-dependent monooxygenase [Agromyces aerolatus]|uniref:NtaA/DmoA family FMN-dependent monooxygenase n=1 Tax=Agromyces sp. LY-1074 TaxID=3074080 RepID=UPI0028546EB8|nr:MULTISPECIES: NtaA/DmoA family FMN-dependent monooxygenase [unclassified Agromyces]MDR5699117.1 NtaA/DmoA family FMN-dependent monooxygenase [Agromyces sp. LY-1074]MDR5705104.1 NtaA/DmoA family FMN-dependent monooxygenase [Agromyces sp. LY-1358]
MTRRTEHMVFAAFASASTTKTSLGAWMHPSTDPGFLSAEYYIGLAQELERGGIDVLFFDDRLAMPAAYGSSTDPAVERGSRVVKLDLVSILGLLAGHTSRIGLGATYSTTYGAPYHVARQFATLDHLSKGRVIWNIVTSLNHDEAENFGTDFLSPDQRYDRADEFLEIVTKLWESWEADAIELDRTTGRFADPEKVARIDFTGEFLSSRGPLTVPRPPQGWPTLLQAGQSGRGRAFAGRWADLIFTTAHSLEAAQGHYADQQRVTEEQGRPAAAAKILPAVMVIVGETEAIAEQKNEFFNELSDPIEQLIFLAEQANFDFEQIPMDETFDDAWLERFTGTRGAVEAFVRSGRARFGPDATLREIVKARSMTAGNRFVGTPAQIADTLEEWFDQYGADGFALMPSDTPGSFEDFTRLVMPELRRRGRVPELTDPEGTLRDRLGLADRTRR